MNGLSAQAGHVTILTEAGSYVPELSAGLFETLNWFGVAQKSAQTWPWFLQVQPAPCDTGVAIPASALIADSAA